jgi:ABC-type sugar transport system permease subunit
VLASYSYQQAIQSSRLGEAAAVSLFLFPGFLVLVFLQLRYLQRRDA